MNKRLSLSLGLSLAMSAAFAGDSVTTGRQVFWLDPSPLLGGIYAGAADGSGSPRLLLWTGKNPDGLAVEKSARRIYFTNMTLLNSKSASVQRGDIVNNRLVNIVDIVPENWGLRTPKQLKLDETGRKVYFAEREGRRVYRAPMAGAKVKGDLEVLVDFTSLPESQHQFVGIEVDVGRNEFYWSDRLTNTIWRAPLNLGFAITPQNIEQFAQKIVQYPTGMVTDLVLDVEGRKLYWADRGEGNELIGETLPAGFIARISVDQPGAPIEYLIRDLLKDPVGISLDKKNGLLFFANTEDGRVFSAPIDGGTPTELHRSLLGAGLEFVDWTP